MKKLRILLLFLLLPLVILSANDSIKKNQKEIFRIGISVGYSYKNFMGPKYFQHTASQHIPDWDFKYDNYSSQEQYSAFTKVPTSGYYYGLEFTCKIFGNKLFVTTGGQFYKRKDVYEISPPSSTYYLNSPRNINAAERYESTYKNTDCMAKLGTQFHKINFFIGVQIPIVVYYEAKYTYTIKSNPNSNFYSTEPEKTFQSVEYPLWKSQLPVMIFPCFEVSYSYKIKHIALQPLIGIDLGLKNTKTYYLKAGLILSYVKLSKPKP